MMNIIKQTWVLAVLLILAFATLIGAATKDDPDFIVFSLIFSMTSLLYGKLLDIEERLK